MGGEPVGTKQRADRRSLIGPDPTPASRPPADPAFLLPAAAAGLWLGLIVEGARPPPRTVGSGLTTAVVGVAVLAVALRPSRLRLTTPGLLAVTLVGFGVIGAGRGAIAEARVAGSPLARGAGREVELWGTLADDPRRGKLGWHATLGVTAWQPGRAPPSSVRGTVWLQGLGPTPAAVQGDRLSVTGLLSAPRGDFSRFLRQRGIAVSCVVGEVLRLGPTRSRLARAAGAVRGALRRSVERVLPPRQGGLLLGLALGDTSRLDPIVQDQFRATGLSHLTAVSGENVAMFLAPILGLLTWLQVGRVARFAGGLLALGFFVALTKGEPSVMRAAAMTGLAMLGVFLGRPRSPPAIMGGAILILLLVDPTLVSSIGFQLSVGATAGMASLAGPVAERLSFVPAGIRVALATSIGAQAGVTPLLLYHFGVVPGVTIPANLLAFPAVGPAMVLGLAAAAVGVVSVRIGLLVAWAARIPLEYLQGVAARLARSPLPSLTSSGGAVPLLVVELALVGGAAWWFRSGRPLSKRAWVASAIGASLFITSGVVRAGPPRWLTVTFLSVGWGDSELVRSPGGANILVDGGPDAALVSTDLARLGVTRLDVVVATHPHADHITGLPAVLARAPVGLVLDPGCRAPSAFYDTFLESVRRAGVPVRHPRVGDRIRVDDLTLQVLAPSGCFHGTASDYNNDSIVLRLSDGRNVVLLGGDAQQESQAEMLGSPELLRAPVVKWFHHGGNTNDPAVYSAIGARVAVICTGPNLYNDPSPLVLQALAKAGIRVVRTDVDGDVTVQFRSEGLFLQSSRG